MARKLNKAYGRPPACEFQALYHYGNICGEQPPSNEGASAGFPVSRHFVAGSGVTLITVDSDGSGQLHPSGPFVTWRRSLLVRRRRGLIGDGGKDKALGRRVFLVGGQLFSDDFLKRTCAADHRPVPECK
jgi:hypothetical protein